MKEILVSGFEDISDGFRRGDDEEFRHIFQRWNGGRWSNETFAKVHALATPQTVIEVAIFRLRLGAIETLTRPRPDNDPVVEWRGKYHTLGSALRNGDVKRHPNEQYQAAFYRIIGQELDGVPFMYAPVYVSIEPPLLRDTQVRGTETVIPFFTEVPDNALLLPKDIKWFDINTLEGNETFLQHQVQHVMLAAKAWRKYAVSKSSN